MTICAGIVRDLPVRALDLCGVTWSGEYLYFAEIFSKQIGAIDPNSGEVVQRIPCLDVAGDLTTLRGALLQVVGEHRDLRLLDPATGDEIDEWPNPRPGHEVSGVEACRDGVWVGYADLGLVELRDPDRFRLLDRVEVGHPVTGVTVSDGFLVHTDRDASRVRFTDLASRRQRLPVMVWGKPRAITWDGRLFWYCDHATLQLRAIELPGITTSGGGTA
ncbi:hypothetical protein FNH05_25150 [Amycolatopsis rhizosphaerae]|uniref:Glutaminyl-peptide cyclotransferase n=1 Tax=Amycolatopsis rhizosphaerae TaxID=2053003 RepID=A0A558BKR1_9PSEU|nr:hypothetical protein [Amycolatopsis rhizosphaerae]TVT37087.1 hypothetical protein FNH05_25150 [Amycolatopsis rhizosphaerae]